MATVAEPTLDAQQLEQFVLTAVDELGATLNAALVVIGDRLGLTGRWPAPGPLTPPSWPSAPAPPSATCASGSTRRRRAATSPTTRRRGRYTLPPEHALALADEDSPAFLPGLSSSRTAPSCDSAHDRARRSRTGDGVGWHEHSHDVYEGRERFFRTGLQREPRRDVAAGARRRRRQARARRPRRRRRLRPRRVDDLMAQAFPQLDVLRLRLPRRRRSPRRGGAQRRRASTIASTSRSPTRPPSRARLRPGDDVRLPARHGRPGRRGPPRARGARRDGTWLIVEPFAGDRVEDNLNPVGRAYYGLSTLLCTPALALAGGRPRARRPGRRGAHPRVAEAAGFTRFRRAAETPLQPPSSRCGRDARGRHRAASRRAVLRRRLRQRLGERPRPGAPRDLRRRHRADQLARPRRLARAASRLGVGPGSTVLDVACGSGGPALQLVRDTGAAVVGIDLHADAIAMASGAHGGRRPGAPASSRPTPKPLPSTDESFDAISCVDAIHRFADRAAVLAEWRRCSARRGRALHRPGRRDRTRLARGLDVRASIGYFSFTPPGENERLLAEAGLETGPPRRRARRRWPGSPPLGAGSGRHVHALEVHEGRTSRRDAALPRMTAKLARERRLSRQVLVARHPDRTDARAAAPEWWLGR